MALGGSSVLARYIGQKWTTRPVSGRVGVKERWVSSGGSTPALEVALAAAFLDALEAGPTPTGGRRPGALTLLMVELCHGLSVLPRCSAFGMP
jgi:hypothetical protein